MELLYDILLNIYSNLYSYSVYIVIGIVIFLIIDVIVKRYNINKTAIKVIIILLSLFLPFCSCISITFLLYKRIIKDEKFVLIAYWLSVFSNISAFIYIYLYLGKFALSLYILFILLIITLISSNVFNRISSQNDRIKMEINQSIDLNNDLKLISSFVFYHFIGICIMSIVNAVFKSVQYFNILNKSISLLIFDNVLLRYTCIPNDLTILSELVYSGYRISFALSVVIISALINIPELIIIFKIVKYKLLLFLSTIISCIGICIVSIIFDNNGATNQVSINYNNFMLKLANSLNVNPHYLIRYASIIIYMFIVIKFLTQKKGELKL